MSGEIWPIFSRTRISTLESTVCSDGLAVKFRPVRINDAPAPAAVPRNLRRRMLFISLFLRFLCVLLFDSRSESTDGAAKRRNHRGAVQQRSQGLSLLYSPETWWTHVRRHGGHFSTTFSRLFFYQEGTRAGGCGGRQRPHEPGIGYSK